MLFIKCFDEKLINHKFQIITILRMYCIYNFILIVIGKHIIRSKTHYEKNVLYNYMFAEKTAR